MARGLEWNCKQGAFLQDPVGHFFAMVIESLESMGRGVTHLFKFVYLKDLSGLMGEYTIGSLVFCIIFSRYLFCAFPPQLE